MDAAAAELDAFIFDRDDRDAVLVEPVGQPRATSEVCMITRPGDTARQFSEKALSSGGSSMSFMPRLFR